MFAMGVAVGDVDRTGTPDLYITDVGGPNLLLSQGDGTYVDATAAVGADIPPEPTSMVSWGTSAVDLDADQDLDLVVTFGRSGNNFIGAVNPDPLHAHGTCKLVGERPIDRTHKVSPGQEGETRGQ
jgi:hypothetical protein